MDFALNAIYRSESRPGRAYIPICFASAQASLPPNRGPSAGGCLQCSSSGTVSSRSSNEICLERYQRTFPNRRSSERHHRYHQARRRRRFPLFVSEQECHLQNLRKQRRSCESYSDDYFAHRQGEHCRSAREEDRRSGNCLFASQR